MQPYYEDASGVIYHGDCIEVMENLPDCSVQCCVTSPPYWGLRDYCVDGQFGAEETLDLYVRNLVDVFWHIRRLLNDDGLLFLNLGDTYKNKELMGIPWRVAFALQADGWFLRSDVIWEKPNVMPESVNDRPTRSHEYIFMLSKSPKYFYDIDATREPHKEVSLRRMEYGLHQKHPSDIGVSMPPVDTERMGERFCNPKGRNSRTVWHMPTSSNKFAHFATFPIELPERCMKAGSSTGDTIIDPFFGSGTSGIAAYNLSRKFIGIEISAEFCDIATTNLRNKTRQSRFELIAEETI